MAVWKIQCQISPLVKYRQNQKINFDINGFQVLSNKKLNIEPCNIHCLIICTIYYLATSARDKVILNPDANRRQWGKPGETVVKALQGISLAEQTMSSEKSGMFRLYYMWSCERKRVQSEIGYRSRHNLFTFTA